MKVIYIASPYTNGDVGQNVAVQLNAAHRLMDMGLCPIAPLLSHFLHIHQFRPYEEWLVMDFELLKRSDIVLRLPGYSNGADREVTEAKNLKIPVAIGWKELDHLLSQS